MRVKGAFFGFASLLTIISVDCGAYEASEGIFGVKNPFFLRATYDIVGASEIDKDPFDGDKLHYSSGTVDLNSFVYYDECNIEGLTVGINYMNTHLGWHNNPAFNQKDFNTGGITFGGFSGRLDDWMFKGFIRAAVDLDHVDFNHYLLWDLAFYGIYTLCDGFRLNFGFYSQLGMKVDRVWPVIGFIWEYSDCIRIDAVFPVDLNIYYKINKCWSAGLGAQFFRTRNRTGQDEPVHRAIWVYENAGLDARINYEMNELTYASFHVGYTVGGKLKITDQHYKERHHYDFDGAPYAGGELGIKF
jgi:hypothetical protein